MTIVTGFGRAGWFSTDNAAADQRQIDAEEFDAYWEKEDDLGYWDEDDFPPQDRDQYIEVVFNCPGNWYKQDVIWDCDEEKETSTAQRRHDAECQCGESITCSHVSP